jgi:putative transposase
MARAMRRPKGVIHHSDQGSPSSSPPLPRGRVRPSMRSVGDAYDNAMCESFFATLECELIDRHRFKTQAEARIAVFDFIEGFYNRPTKMIRQSTRRLVRRSGLVPRRTR